MGLFSQVQLPSLVFCSPTASSRAGRISIIPMTPPTRMMTPQIMKPVLKPSSDDAAVSTLTAAHHRHGCADHFPTTNLSYSFHAFQAELYPTRIRSRAIGFTYSWSRFSTIFVGFMVAFFCAITARSACSPSFAAAMLACCLVIGLMGPQTARLRLEQISRQ